MGDIMGDRELENKAWFKASKDVQHICQPLLSQTPVVAVQYQRIYTDGSRTILSTNNGIVVHRYVKPDAQTKEFYTPRFRQEGRYNLMPSWADGVSDPTASKRLQIMFQEEKELFNVTNEFVIIDRKTDYEETIEFSMLNDRAKEENFYFNNLNTLERFRLYFLDKARNLIESVDKERAVGAWRNPHSSIAYINQLNNHPIILEELMDPKNNHSKLSDIMPTKFYFMVNGQENFLTKRELECILQLIQGKTSIEIAKKLFISPRTVEDHVESLKTKTGMQNRHQLIEFFGNIGLSRIC